MHGMERGWHTHKNSIQTTPIGNAPWEMLWPRTHKSIDLIKSIV
jgi:hypothetical protein